MTDRRAAMWSDASLILDPDNVIGAAIAELGPVGAAFEPEVRELRTDVSQLIRAVVGALDDPEAELGRGTPPLLALGAEIARRQLPPRLLKTLARSTVRLVSGAIIQAYADSGLDEGRRPHFSNGVMNAVLAGERATTAMLEGFTAETERHLPEEIRAPAIFAERLLEARWADRGELERAAADAGIQGVGEFALLVAFGRAGARSAGMIERAADRLRELPGSFPTRVRIRPIPHVAVLVAGVGPDRWPGFVLDALQLMASESLVLMPRGAFDDPCLVGPWYQGIERHLGLIEGVLPADARIVDPSEVLMCGIIAESGAESLERHFVEVLGPVLGLREDTRRELFEAYELVYLASGSLARAASKGLVSERTLRYRLSRLQQVSRHRLDVPAERSRIDLAFRARQLAFSSGDFDEERWGPRTRALRHLAGDARALRG